MSSFASTAAPGTARHRNACYADGRVALGRLRQWAVTGATTQRGDGSTSCQLTLSQSFRFARRRRGRAAKRFACASGLTLLTDAPTFTSTPAQHNSSFSCFEWRCPLRMLCS